MDKSKSEIKRMKHRGFYDKKTIYEIIDQTCFCHISFVIDNSPFIIPVNFGRFENYIYIHGAFNSRLITHLEAGHEIAVAFTIADALVLTKSAAHTSFNYHSVIAYGKGESVNTNAEKMLAFEVMFNQMLKGRWEEIRKPNEEELESVAVIKIDISEASAKIREGFSKDNPEDQNLDVWSGILPYKKGFDASIPDKFSENLGFNSINKNSLY
jgi:nitroimidazol reductase NimA-like FMN-containing flavoprotein (pyridoxamine 5'-phosphate oxidase superfamily)